MRLLSRTVVVTLCAIIALLVLLADPGCAQDTQPPTTPPGFTAVAYARSVKLTWSGSTDNVGVTGYEVYRNDILLTTVSGVEYIDAPAPWATLQYKVRAVDGAGNRSEPTPVKTVTSHCWMEQRPANWTYSHSGRRHHVFYVGESVRFDLEMAPCAMCPRKDSQATRYEVRDYYGNLVDEGSAGQSIVTNVAHPGWYKLYLYGAQEQFPWGKVLGGTNFVVFRDIPGFPKLPPARDPRAPGDDPFPVGTASSQNSPLRGLLGSGPCRLYVQNASNPVAEIARLEQDVALDEQWYLPHDPLRERKLMIAFPNGTSDLAGVRKIVEHFKDRVKYWEPRNEPNDGITGEAFALNEMKPFCETVKGVSPDLKVMGPGTVSVGPGLQGYLRSFFGAGGGNWIDVFSFHAYNNVEGDLFLARKSMTELESLLTEFGVEGKERWQTEQGYFAPVYGSYEPRRQARWTMLQMMLFEQYAIPKEQNYYWYERSHGFWDFPTWLANEDGSLNPGAVVLRVWAEELYGTRFARAFDFGETGNKLYIGSLFEGPGKKVATFMSAGSTDGKVTLLLPGAQFVTVVSALGEERTTAVENGRLVLDVPEIPVYVRLAEGQQIEVAPVDWGPDLARLPGVEVRSSGTGVHPVNPSISNDILKLVNGVMETSRWQLPDSGRPWMDNTEGFPAWVELAFPSERTIDRVIIYSFPFWQWEGTLLDYELQYERDGQWLTIEHVTEPTKTSKVFSPQVKCTVDGFFSERWIFQHSFPPVTARKIRILVHDCTWGGGATKDAVDAGGQTGPHQVVLREIEVYDTSSPRISISGRVVDSQGNGIAGVPITLSGLESRESTTDASGHYSFAGLVSGCNRVVRPPNSGYGYQFYPKEYTAERLESSTWAEFRASPVPQGTGSGLLGSYYNSLDWSASVGSRLDPRVVFDWQRTYPFPGLTTLGYSVRWTGQVQPRYSETYTFKTQNYDGVRLWVNGVRLVSHWDRSNMWTRSGTIELQAGRKYDLQLEYAVFGAGLSYINLSWSSPSQPEEIIPTSQLYPYNPDEWNQPFNYAPTAQDATLTTRENTAVPIVLQATDPESQPLSYAVLTQPMHGALSGTAPNLTYTPAADYNGPDSFTFKANDGVQDSNVATVSITVAPVNSPPVAAAQSVTTVANAARAITLSATDSDSATLTYSIVANPGHGSLSGTTPAVTYTPTTGYVGADSFTFKANDGAADSNVATVSITVGAGSPPPQVTSTMTGQPVDPKPGEKVHYVVTYTNPGPDPIANFVLSVPVPDNTDYVAGSASSGGQYDSGRRLVHYTFSVLAAGETGEVSFDATVR